MRSQLTLHPEYPFLETWIRNLSQSPSLEGRLMIDGRNQVSEVTEHGERYVVKYFKHITKANRYIYRYFRASKGKRAYNNALILLSKGISTPFPIANLDVYEHGQLKQNYFVSRYVDYSSAYELMSKPYHEIETELKALADFLFKLHRLGIFHADLNLTNVLYYYTPSGIEFCLIDNNRIRFRPYTKRRAMRNLRRLQMPLVNYATLIDEYARQANQNVFTTFGMMMFYREVNNNFRRMRKALKQLLLESLDLLKSEKA